MQSCLPTDTPSDFTVAGLGPTLSLKEGLDLNDLTNPNCSGAEIEFLDEGLEEKLQNLNIEENKAYFEGMSRVTRMFDNDSDEEKNPDLSWFDQTKSKMKNITEDGGVKKFIRREGVGIVVPPGSKIRAHYEGYLEDLDEPYDSSRLRNRELQITLGKFEVIQGLEIALSSMRVKEVARFLVSSSYAYGSMGCPPRIPGNVSIIFEVEFLGFTESSALDDYKELSDQEKRDLPFEKLLAVAKASKDDGNDFFARQNFSKAIRKYMNAINILETIPLRGGDEEEQVIYVCIKCYMNAAVCYLRQNQYGRAVAASKKVLGWKKEHPKALYTCGKALRHLGNFAESRRFLLRARAVRPHSKEVAIELKTLDEFETKCNAVEKKMCQKMFS